MDEKFTVNVGDKVAFSADFLVSIGCQTGDLPAMRGTVTRVIDLSSVGNRQLVTYVDQDGHEAKALNTNLCTPGPNPRFCRC